MNRERFIFDTDNKGKLKEWNHTGAGIRDRVEVRV